jgi:hypothetical protein
MSPTGRPEGEYRSAQHEGTPVSAGTPEPRLSVVVTVVDGGAVLLRCLEAIAAQVGAPAMEVIVPWDETIGEVGTLAARFPRMTFLPLGRLWPAGRAASPFDAHVLYDRRRAGGLRAARGTLLAMLEDRGWPRPNWAATMADLHERLPHGAIGGAIENGAEDRLRHAVFHCDFGRYEPPLAGGEVDFASDINICYKRQALEGLRSLWSERYQEAEINWALLRRGDRLWLCDSPRVVQQRAPLSLAQALRERVHWGRTFGLVRGRAGSRMHALVRAVVSPLVPGMLLVRHLRRQRNRGRPLQSTLAGLPLMTLLVTCWAAGEAAGEFGAAMAGTGAASQPGVSLR